MRYKYLPYMMLLPVFTMIVVVIFVPLITTFLYSFQSNQLSSNDSLGFVGLLNYAQLVNNPRFWSSVVTTLVYVGGSVLGMLLLGLVTAQIANQPFKGQNIFRASILIPWAIAPVVAAQAWKFMFEIDYGIINHVLSSLGLVKQNILWLVTSSHAMLSVVITNVWKTTPMLTLILIGGLQTISKDLYESAEIDGSNSFQKFIYITLPLIKPFILLGLIFTTLQTVNVIDIVYVMTGGGPGESTEILTLYNYRLFFQYLDFGLGGAMAMLSVIVIGILISFYIRDMNRNLND